MANNTGVPPPDHLSGKRRWRRQGRVYEVLCKGAHVTIRAQSLNISRNGMLVEAHHTDLPDKTLGDIVPLAFMVAAAFADGLKVSIGTDVSVDAEIVRMTTSPQDPGYLRLGCRFLSMLTRRQCTLLGIDGRNIPDPALDVTPPAEDWEPSVATKVRAPAK